MTDRQSVPTDGGSERGALRVPLKAEAVTDIIRRRILSGDLLPGQRLPETRIARELGISQAPVREALAVLSQQGLVMKESHRGAFVAVVDKRTHWEVMDLRQLLEAHCARRAATAITPDQLAALESCIAEMTEAGQLGDLRGVTEADLKFHRTMADSTGHRLLAELLRGLGVRDVLAAADSVAPAEVGESHRALFTALQAHDPEAAADQAARHVRAGTPAEPTVSA